jgi:hypothetical protein
MGLPRSRGPDKGTTQQGNPSPRRRRRRRVASSSRSVRPGHAVWEGMREVEPGTVMTVGANSVRAQVYWNLQIKERTDDRATASPTCANCSTTSCVGSRSRTCRAAPAAILGPDELRPHPTHCAQTLMGCLHRTRPRHPNSTRHGRSCPPSG